MYSSFDLSYDATPPPETSLRKVGGDRCTVARYLTIHDTKTVYSY